MSIARRLRPIALRSLAHQSSSSLLRPSPLRFISLSSPDGESKESSSESSDATAASFDRQRLVDSASLDADEGLEDASLPKFSTSTYPERDLDELFRRRNERREKLKPLRSDADHSHCSVLLFPGQGAQFVGMGTRALQVPNVKDLYERAGHILNFDLLKLCLEGPSDLLNQTRYCQPAIVVSSLAAVEKLYREKPEAIERCVAVAGFSVGEITALIFSGAISFDDGIELVKTRSEAMQYCSEMESGGMMTVFFGSNANIGLACEAARTWVNDNDGVVSPVCKVANFLYVGAKVIAGHNQALRFIEENHSDFGIRRTVRLPVSGAFHTTLMNPAVPVMKEAINKMTVYNPRLPIYSNVDGEVITHANRIKKLVPLHMTKTVRWEQSMHKLFFYKDENLMPSVYECGPGNTLSGILKKINGKVGRRTTFVPI